MRERMAVLCVLHLWSITVSEIESLALAWRLRLPLLHALGEWG